jgi:hypothetical protein
MELNPLAAMLLEKISADENRTGQEILQQISKEIDHPDPSIIVQGGCELMYQMTVKHILLGTQKKHKQAKT